MATDPANGGGQRGALPLRALGRTGLTVTALGFGTIQAGAPSLPERDAEALLHGVLDLGIRLVDTAPSYGIAEQRIGRYLAHRREEFVLSTKVGYGVDGCADWTYDCVARGIDRARDRLRTDVIDVVHLHSCPRATLAGSGVVDALLAVVAQGKVRVAAYSGERDALDYALALAAGPARAFGAIQLSVNPLEPRSAGRISIARRQGLGVLAKRPLFGLPWLAGTPPEDAAHAEYWRRYRVLLEALAPRDVSADAVALALASGSAADWSSLALRYAAFAAGVDACLVGGASLGNVRANVASVLRGAPPPEVLAALHDAQALAGADWDGIV